MQMRWDVALLNLHQVCTVVHAPSLCVPVVGVWGGGGGSVHPPMSFTAETFSLCLSRLRAPSSPVNLLVRITIGGCPWSIHYFFILLIFG